ncbi:MAG: family 20 glycosylhydrolase, partial [Planctomycetota bacterium]
GCASLLQALQEPRRAGEPPRIPCLSMKDRPQNSYRSLMIDVARKPHTIPVLQDVIRLAHLYKLRYVHLHLTDDQLFTFPFDPVVEELEGNVHFSRAELSGLVDYASARGVVLIPEIDLPGHSRRLIESGYLDRAEDHADVAAPRNFEKVHALLDEVMEVFHTSPYLHIGGDESGAGKALLPFLASVQNHVRSRDKRLIVWEGFHGAPTDVLPATGEDRVIVAAWESSYNPPWNLLAAGYEVINASWKPLYVVGGGAAGIHPGSSGGRRWTPTEMADWRLDRFQHWEPHRPVFEDQGSRRRRPR